MLDEFREWVPLVKDTMLALAAVATAFVAISGLRTWKRELAGKEHFTAAKELVRSSHRIWRECGRLRLPLSPREQKVFSAEDVQNTTSAERWRIADWEAYSKRLDDFEKVSDEYHAALLSARVLLGSKVYEAFLPFNYLTIDLINIVNEYLDLLQPKDGAPLPDDPEVIETKKRISLRPGEDDELSRKIADAREDGEKALLPYLARSSIRG